MGTHTQKGSLTIVNTGVTIKRSIKIWCTKTNEYNDSLVNIFYLQQEWSDRHFCPFSINSQLWVVVLETPQANKIIITINISVIPNVLSLFSSKNSFIILI